MTPSDADITKYREQVKTAALAAFEVWGWGEKGIVAPDGSARIAAARGTGAGSLGKKDRQGGASLATIFGLAGVGSSNCHKITTIMEQVYQQDPAKHPERTERINKEDIGSWCGIFATYCHCVAGHKVTWDLVKTQSKEVFEVLGHNAHVLPGDIGVMDPVTNHHFLVLEESAPNVNVHSLDGNVGNPSENVVTPWNSVISKRFYLRTTLAKKGGRFLRRVKWGHIELKRG